MPVPPSSTVPQNSGSSAPTVATAQHDQAAGDPGTVRPPGLGRRCGLVALVVAALLIPGLLLSGQAGPVLSYAGFARAPESYLAIALVSPGGVDGFVSAGRARSVRFEITSALTERRTVPYEVSLVPDRGGSRRLAQGAVDLGAGQSQFGVFAGRVPCTSRGRVVISAQAVGARPVSVAFHVRAYKSHGSLICTSFFLDSGS